MMGQWFMNGVCAACAVLGFAAVLFAAVLAFCAIITVLAVLFGEPRGCGDD